jgi:hypothetical protein
VCFFNENNCHFNPVLIDFGLEKNGAADPVQSKFLSQKTRETRKSSFVAGKG